jgi:hypothetical protein
MFPCSLQHRVQPIDQAGTGFRLAVAQKSPDGWELNIPKRIKEFTNVCSLRINHLLILLKLRQPPKSEPALTNQSAASVSITPCRAVYKLNKRDLSRGDWYGRSAAVDSWCPKRHWRHIKLFGLTCPKNRWTKETVDYQIGIEPRRILPTGLNVNRS